MQKLFEEYKKSEIIDTKRVLHTPSDAARKMFFYIQEAGYLKSLKPHLSKRSGLNSFLFLVVISGNGTITLDNKSYDISTGDCFLLDCHREYSHISQYGNPWELLWLHFNGPLALQYYKYVISRNGHCFQTVHFNTITERIRQLIESNGLQELTEDILCSQYITDILTLSITGHKKKSSSPAQSKEKLSQILDYLNHHFTEPITLELLSEHFFISKYHLAREFKRVYNQTIIQYIQTQRITYAKELLRFSALSIEEIARKCGIEDASYFNKVFKKLEGSTASEYRKKW